MTIPVVSVICLCYNHESFVAQAIESVLAQTHTQVELIVIDDASTDNSVEVIRRTLQPYPAVRFISNSINLGNCKAFNLGLKLASGSFVIDLAADDILLPERISAGLEAFETSTPDHGVNFGDAERIDAAGNHLGFHSDKFPTSTIPQGDIYKEVVARYFICSPSMMFRKSVLEALGGYDESLAYEDFDFWVRSSRQFLYCYTNKVLVKRRILPHAMGAKQYRFRSRQSESTFVVCSKILALNRNSDESRALDKRIGYEIKKSIQFGNLSLAIRYFRLRAKNRRSFPVVVT